MKLNLLRLAFGWNHKLWSKPFLELLKKTDLLQKESLHILEIGASRRSCVSLLFGSRINYIETPSGCVITIDNGKRFISGAFARFGAQKLGWRCFSPNDFCDVTYQSSFGFLNSFSLETRLGHLGYFLDNYLMYYLDCVAYKLIKKYPTVIVTLFKTKN